MIKPISDKKRARLPERQAIVERVKIKYPTCALSCVYGLPSRSDPLDPDELAPRSEWTNGIYVFENVWMLRRSLHENKHHKRPAAAMMLGLYGPERMRRWDIPVEDRVEYFYEFAPGLDVDEIGAKIFLWEAWNRIIPGYWESEK